METDALQLAKLKQVGDALEVTLMFLTCVSILAGIQ